MYIYCVEIQTYKRIDKLCKQKAGDGHGPETPRCHLKCTYYIDINILCIHFELQLYKCNIVESLKSYLRQQIPINTKESRQSVVNKYQWIVFHFHSPKKINHTSNDVMRITLESKPRYSLIVLHCGVRTVAIGDQSRPLLENSILQYTSIQHIVNSVKD